MKKIVSMLLTTVCMVSLVNAQEMCESHFNTALTTGYVFKNKQRFHDVYGHGIANLITADGCYYTGEYMGFGANVAYWRGQGSTSFLRQHTLLQQVPVVLYVRGIKRFGFGLDVYGSLGGGFIWTKEKSYLGRTRVYNGIGAVEVGAAYPIWRCIELTAAFRYLFPPQTQAGQTVDIGGCDLRIGFGITF